MDLSARAVELGDFSFQERSGAAVTQADLSSKVWIASFIFTRCPLSCPKISTKMSEIQTKLAGSGVQLVSISVDPEFDTPSVLARYADKFHADRDRWWFLNAPKSETYNLIEKRFKLSVQAVPSADQREGIEAISHSARLALVDRGNKVIGLYDSDDPDALAKLVVRARQRAFSWMPALNASLNGLCGILLVVGWMFIRARKTRAHAVSMITCTTVSALFLACYLMYHYLVRGSVPFKGIGPIRLIYFGILISHTLLAIAVVPLVLIVLARAYKKRFESHAKVATVLLPIWLYVSITGVVVYWMLYQMPFGRYDQS